VFNGKPAESVVLVRHAKPIIDPNRRAGEWAIDKDASGDVLRFTESFRELRADGIVSSPEPKALGTARLIADALDLSVREDADLREQGNDVVPWFDEPADFRRAVAEHFRRSSEVVFGSESSEEAVDRFAAAVSDARSRSALPIIVSHGRVMCGYMSSVCDVDPVEIWEDLRLPDAFLLRLDTRTFTRVGER
jgi:broad specificity phosphatase PhoE